MDYENTLTQLELGENNITHIGGTILFKCLKRNQTITSLSLGNYNTENQNKLGPVSSKYIREFLTTSQVIAFLDLRMNNLGDKGMYQIACGLKENRSLVSLNVACN